jgi:thiosulfate reductase cytochrome b subunit
MIKQASNKRIRDAQRITHLTAAAVLALALYAPVGSVPLAAVLKFGAIPLLVVTGLLMWQWTRLRRWLTARFARGGATTQGQH